jgi:hypothetical protein
VQGNRKTSIRDLLRLQIAAELSRFLTTDCTDTIWIKTQDRLSQIPSTSHPLPIRGKKNALVDSEPINHGLHGYDLDKTQGRLSQIPSIPHPLPLRDKKSDSVFRVFRVFRGHSSSVRNQRRLAEMSVSKLSFRFYDSSCFLWLIFPPSAPQIFGFDPIGRPLSAGPE